MTNLLKLDLLLCACSSMFIGKLKAAGEHLCPNTESRRVFTEAACTLAGDDATTKFPLIRHVHPSHTHTQADRMSDFGSGDKLPPPPTSHSPNQVCGAIS